MRSPRHSCVHFTPKYKRMHYFLEGYEQCELLPHMHVTEWLYPAPSGVGGIVVYSLFQLVTVLRRRHDSILRLIPAAGRWCRLLPSGTCVLPPASVSRVWLLCARGGRLTKFTWAPWSETWDGDTGVVIIYQTLWLLRHVGPGQRLGLFVRIVVKCNILSHTVTWRMFLRLQLHVSSDRDTCCCCWSHVGHGSAMDDIQTGSGVLSQEEVSPWESLELIWLG